MSESKRQYLPQSTPKDLPPGLWIVATPIGNLSDISQRARSALSCASVILCEDTRRTAQLLNALGIAAPPLKRFDAHSSPAEAKRWAQDIFEAQAGGQAFALVSDAGTPAVSDPGAKLVEAAVAQDVRITPVPGPSAVTSLLSVAGWESTSFAFLGFFPRKTGERKKALEEAARSGVTAVWFESPERITESLETLAEADPSRPTFAAKEITKLHEKFFRGSALEVFRNVENEIQIEGRLGEWAFAVHYVSSISVQSDEWMKAVRVCLDVGVSASEAAKRVSQHFGVAKNRVYEYFLELSGKKTTDGG